MIDEQYEQHVKKCWIWAEQIAVKCGSTDNATVVAIFDKIATPLHFFKMDHNKW